MTTKAILVTGATDGIGQQTATLLAAAGHRVLIHGRSAERLAAAQAALLKEVPDAKVTQITGDLSDLDSVRAMAKQVQATETALDVLVNNAGVFMREKVMAPSGLEMSAAVNHLGHFLLTHLLMPQLTAAAPARVVNVSSVAHARGRLNWAMMQGEGIFDGYAAYAQSKLLNLLFTVEFARRIPVEQVTANALHPGVVGTKLLRTGFGMGGQDSLEKGAQTSVFLATHDSVTTASGLYYVRGEEADTAPGAHDPQSAKEVWEDSCKRCGITW